MRQLTCAVCAASFQAQRPQKYCTPRCKWTAANRKRYKRRARTCPGCGLDLSDRYGKVVYCSDACRSWVRNGHTDLRQPAAMCLRCGKSMTGKRVNAIYCTRKCKLSASEARRVRDDAARYQAERERRITYALAYARTNPHVGRAAKNKRKAWKRDAGVFILSGKEWRRLCARQRGECIYCGMRADLTMDHVIPLSKGGRHSIGNVMPACATCNSSKSDNFLSAWKVKRQRG